MMRCYLVKICKAKPIGLKDRVFHYLEIDRVSTPIVCLEKKNQSGPLAVATILATAVMDTMMTMTKQEYGRAGHDGAQPMP